MKLKIKSKKNKTDANCIFCKIAKKEIPSDIVFEDKNFFAFLDINPVSHGHILIIPKEHIIWMQEANDKIISDIFILTKKLMLVMKKAMPCDYVQVSVNGEEVPHFHIHLIPRYFNDDLPQFPRKKYQGSETSELVKKITSAL
jgi:histidine triad (HIT) family protein